METAIFHAGAWLRAVHESSPQGCEALEFLEVVDALRGLIRKKELQATVYAQWALKAVETLGQILSPRTSLHIPVALNHGDFSLPNLIWDPDREHLWVVDFELSARKAILHDLCTMIFELRKPLLYPHTSRRAVEVCESAFWAGYGVIAEDLFVLVNALATARLFYQSFPRISTLPERRGWKGWLKATLYKGLFQRYATARILQGAGL
jgi:Ser/Thr protein kinase RdoA (MazF antagonist)